MQICQARCCRTVVSRNRSSCEVGGADSVEFTTNRTGLTRTLTIREDLSQSGLIIAPKKTNFPLIDLLFSLIAVVSSCLCLSMHLHPFPVRALYGLRCEQLKIPDTQILNICEEALPVEGKIALFVRFAECGSSMDREQRSPC